MGITHYSALWIPRFCFICQDVRACQIVEKYHPPRRINVLECPDCKTLYEFGPNQFLTPLPGRSPGLKELIRASHPELPASLLHFIHAFRLACQGTGDPIDRASILRLPFTAVSNMVDAPHNPLSDESISSHHWAETTVYVVGVIVTAMFVFPIAAILGIWLFGSNNTGSDVIALGMTFASILAVILFIHRAFAQYRKNKLARYAQPRLARALRPLRPTEKELEDIALWLEAWRSPLRKAINWKKLADDIRTAKDESLQVVDELQLEEWGREILKSHTAAAVFDASIEEFGMLPRDQED